MVPAAWQAWMPATWVPVVGGLVWGILLQLLPLFPAPVLIIYLRGRWEAVSLDALLGTACLIAGATSRLVDGMLMVPGCPLWVAVWLPWATSVVGGDDRAASTGNGQHLDPAAASVAVAEWASVLGKSAVCCWAAVQHLPIKWCHRPTCR